MGKGRGFALLMAFFFVLSVTHACLAQDLESIHQAIQSKGARWIAGDTSIARLSLGERSMRARLIKPHHTGQERLLTAHLEQAYSTPASLDWRNINGQNYVTPVRDQGACGSCWAFASAAGLESSKLIAANTPGIDLNLAEQILVSCSGAGDCNGGYINGAADFMRNVGLPLESCYPYTAANGTCSNACANYQSSSYKIQSWNWVTTTSNTTVDSLKSAVYTYGPLLTTMDVYADFFYYHSGVYTYTSGTYQGGHAVLIVGYDDAGQYFIVKNSWGTGWGESGYFKIGYSELNTVVNFGDWTIAYASAAPTCTYSLSTTTTHVDASGGPASVSVNASGTTCGWTAASNASWITITSGTGATGSGGVYYTVAANAGSSSRTGTMTVAGQTYTITQDGSTCTSSVTQNFGASGGTGSLKVTTPSSCTWQATTTDTWITITSGATGTGTGSVNYSVQANTTAAARVGSMSVAGQTWSITQDAGGTTCSYSISPTSQTVSASAGTGSVSVTTTAGCSWVATSNAGWISVTSGSSGSGNGTVNYSVTANTTTSQRTGTITIAGKTFTVTQDAASSGSPAIAVSPTSLNFGTIANRTSSSKTVTVSNTGTANLVVSLVSLWGSSSSYYRQSNTCGTVTPGGSCTITVTFAPFSTGTKSAYVNVYSNDPASPTTSITLNGIAK